MVRKQQNLQKQRHSSYSKRWGKAEKSGSKSEKKAACLLEESLRKNQNLQRFFGEDITLKNAESRPHYKVLIVGNSRVQRESNTGTVQPKTDVEVLYGDIRRGISVKSGVKGQVGLYRVKNFKKGLENQTGFKVSEEIEELLNLFAGAETTTQLAKQLMRGRHSFVEGTRQIRAKERVAPRDMLLYTPELLEKLLEFLRIGIVEVTDFVFFKGTSQTQQADLLWYLGAEPNSTLNGICTRNGLLKAVEEWRDKGNMLTVGLNGSTIQLPFGSLQANRGQLQFNHQKRKLHELKVVFR